MFLILWLFPCVIIIYVLLLLITFRFYLQLVSARLSTVREDPSMVVNSGHQWNGSSFLSDIDQMVTRVKTVYLYFCDVIKVLKYGDFDIVKSTFPSIPI